MDMQAREDANAAVTLLKASPHRRPVCCRESSHGEQLGQAYAALGDAYMAQQEHADRDCSKALEVCKMHELSVTKHPTAKP